MYSSSASLVRPPPKQQGLGSSALLREVPRSSTLPPSYSQAKAATARLKELPPSEELPPVPVQH
jgi:hypothetical protein